MGNKEINVLTRLADRVEDAFRSYTSVMQEIRWSGIADMVLDPACLPKDGIRFSSETFTRFEARVGFELVEIYKVPKKVSQTYNVPFRAELWSCPQGGKIAIRWNSDTSQDRYIAIYETDLESYVDAHNYMGDISWNRAIDPVRSYRKAQVAVRKRAIGLPKNSMALFYGLYKKLKDTANLPDLTVSAYEPSEDVGQYHISAWKQKPHREMLGVYQMLGGPDEVMVVSFAIQSRSLGNLIRLHQRKAEIHDLDEPAHGYRVHGGLG